MSTVEDAARTKESIAQALFALMEEKPYEKITVKEIVERAGVGRATYYRHFTSKEDVVEDFLRRESPAVDRLITFTPHTRDDYYEVVFVVFSQLKKRQHIMRLLQRAGLELLYLRFLTDAMTNLYEGGTGAGTAVRGRSHTQARYAACYAAGSLFAVSMEWVGRGCQEPVRAIVDMFFERLFPDPLT